jgi:predicted AAA+ superfamily ATPase
MMVDPEAFLEDLAGERIVLDEIHRLDNPSEVLKIAADHYTATRVIATGSSTLGASAKFRDALSGRKTDFWLTPMMSIDLKDFDNEDLSHRMLRGGMPSFFLEKDLPERDFQDWMDAFWAKDIQELFRLERRHSFQKFIELLMAQSGGMFEATRFAAPCEVSRTTISNYLSVLEATFVINIVRPFSTHRPTEIVSAPKVYGFDTGFVCYYRGWYSLRSEDFGLLWEHYVLNEIHANFQTRRINYWRDKRGHEVDFIIARRNQPPVAIECKWSASDFDPAGIKAFRKQYLQGENFVVANDVDRQYARSYANIKVTFVNLAGLIRRLAKKMQ